MLPLITVNTRRKHGIAPLACQQPFETRSSRLRITEPGAARASMFFDFVMLLNIYLIISLPGLSFRPSSFSLAAHLQEAG